MKLNDFFLCRGKEGPAKGRGVLGLGGAVIYFTYAAAASSVWAESPFNRLVYVGCFSSRRYFEIFEDTNFEFLVVDCGHFIRYRVQVPGT